MINTELVKSITTLREVLSATLIEQKNTLCQWSAINSGSDNLTGLAQMKAVLASYFEALGGTQSTVASKPYEFINAAGEVVLKESGDCLVIEKRWQAASNRVLLCGHMDTVFSVSHPFQIATELEDNLLNGPGVADMKGGLLVMFNALNALEQSTLANNIGWKIIINADEETGSLGSRHLLESCAQEATIGLVYEPSLLPDGTFAGQRKGSGKFSLIATGVAAHAGRAFYQGRNAICHLADFISDLKHINDPNRGLTVNVGLISGGQALNMVPAKAVAKLDVRCASEQDKSHFLATIDQLLEKYNQQPDLTIECHGEFSRPIKPLTTHSLKLYNYLKRIGDALEQPIQWQPAGGCCDGNNLSAKGLPVIDTLGVRGGAIHSEMEYMYIDSLIDRSVLSAALLMGLASGDIL